MLRVLDVNLNRAAEGLRTLEDIARVVREDSACAAVTKSLRHALADLAARLPRLDRLASRAVYADAGTGLSTAAEAQRANWGQLVAAACERVLQSLRVLEETTKLSVVAIQGDELSVEFKQLRYRAYDQLAEVERRLTTTRQFAAPQLYLLIDCSQSLDQFVSRISGLKQAGVGLFQIRDKRADGAQLLDYAKAAVAAVGADAVVINDRVDIALASGAGGVHVGQEDLPIEAVRQLSRGSELWIGVSTHDLDQARKAQQAGADYIGCGPTFPSTTKQFTGFAGLEFLKQVAQEIDVPAYAIGGISAQNLPQVIQAGLSRIAVSGAILSSSDPAIAAQELAKMLVAKSER